MEPILRVSGLTKRYGALEAVHDLCLEVAPGEVVGLLGPNGAGKTTALECVLGLRQADAGGIVVDGVNTGEQPASLRRAVGAMLQSTALPDAIRPIEALQMFGAFYGSEQPTELLARVGLREQARTAFAKLSGGQKQRLALALALVGEPRLLVLDEPTAGLDPHLRREFLELVDQRRRAGVGVLMSTHELVEAEHACDRVMILDQGHVVAAGSPSDLIDQADAPSRIVLELRELAGEPPFAGWLGVEQISAKGDRWTLVTRHPTKCLAALTRWLAADSQALLDLRLERPTLAEVYFAKTGRRWSAGPVRGEVVS